MFCINCGAKLSKDINSCGACGSEVYQDEIYGKNNYFGIKNFSKKQVKKLLFLGALIFAFLIYFYLNYTAEQNKIKKEKFNQEMQKIFEEGRSDLQNKRFDSAARKITMAAEGNIVNAQSTLGVMYSEGAGFNKDLKKSVEWHLKASEGGSVLSQYLLYTMYFSGVGVDKDYNKAFEFALKAAKQGSGPGQLALGMSYEGGRGVAQDMKKAAEWYEKSASEGVAAAMYRLGRLYVIGQGVEKNETKGLELVKQAANKGDEDAIAFVNKLRISNYSNLVACLHPYAPGLAATLATTLMQVSANNTYAFGSIMTSSTYSQFCEVASGTPGEENIRIARKVAESGSNVYWVADRGQAAVGFIERK